MAYFLFSSIHLIIFKFMQRCTKYVKKIANHFSTLGVAGELMFSVVMYKVSKNTGYQVPDSQRSKRKLPGWVSGNFWILKNMDRSIGCWIIAGHSVRL